MLMPQTLPSTAKIEITYSVKAPDNTTITFNGTKEVSLSGTWEKNKNIRYILELPTDAKEVKLTPKVNTWRMKPITISTMLKMLQNKTFQAI